MVNNKAQNDLKKEIEDELKRALQKQKLIDFKLKLKGNLGGQKEINDQPFGSTQGRQSAVSKEQGAKSREQRAVSQTPTEPTPKEAAGEKPDSFAPNTGKSGGQRKSGPLGAKDNQPAAKKSAATKQEGQQSAAEKESQAAGGENPPRQPGQGQKPPVEEKPGAESQPPMAKSPVGPQEANQQPPVPATKPAAAQGQAEQTGQAPGSAPETAPAGTQKSPAQAPPAVSPPANPNILKRAWQAMRQKPASQTKQPPAQGLGEPTMPASSKKEGKEGGGGKGEEEESRSPRQYQADLDKKKKEAKAKQEGVKAAVEGPAEIEGKLKKLKQIYRIINGTSALTLWGIIVTFLVMNAQLVFANMSPIATLFKIPLPKLDLWEIGLLLLVDLVVAAILFLLIIIIYFIITCTGGFLGLKPFWCGAKLWL